MRFHVSVPLTTRPSVTVVIPCYNYGRFLPDAVSGALDQQGVDVDVVIVDDASTDDSAAVATRLARSDDRVQVLVHDRNRGHIATYNDGLARARGDYVTLVSADDVLTRNALTRAASLMEYHPSVGLVYGYARSFGDAVPATSDRVRNWSVYPGQQWLGLAARRGRCFISSPEAVMRRAALEEAGGYDARLPHSADFDMWLRTAARWNVGRVNGPVQACYRVHDASMHLTTYAGWLTDLEERRRTFDILFDERAPDLDGVRALQPVAMRALAREATRRALAAQRDRSEAAAAGYLEFAAATCPSIRTSPAWRIAAACERGAVDVPGPGVLRTAGRVGHHLRWRRERRYGT